MNLSPQKLNELKAFIELCKKQPQIIHSEQLSFFRDYLLSLGAKLPDLAKSEPVSQPPSQSPATDFDDMPDLEEPRSEKEKVMEESKEEEEELDPELMVADSEAEQEMGDAEKEPTDAMIAEANELKSKALDEQRAGHHDEAIKLFTQAIRLHSKSGLLYASRAACFLAAKRPNAAIKDCDAAIKVNPDSGKAYKIRGKAKRYLGQYEEASKDLAVGMKLDWDEATYEVQKFVLDRLKKQQERQRKKHEDKKPEEKKHQESGKPPQPTPSSPGFGFPGTGGGLDPNIMNKILSDPDILAALSDPSTQQKMQEIMTDPSKMAQYQNDPKIMNIFAKLQKAASGK